MAETERGAGGTPGGIGEFLMMLVLLAGGLGLVARSLRSGRSAAPPPAGQGGS